MDMNLTCQQIQAIGSDSMTACAILCKQQLDDCFGFGHQEGAPGCFGCSPPGSSQSAPMATPVIGLFVQGKD